jgi:signal transduction histidine kinase
VLASHAAVAFQNATLLQGERESAETASALLQLSQKLTSRHAVGDILQDAIEAIPALVPAVAAAAYVLDAPTGDFKLARLHAVGETVVRPRAEIPDVPAVVSQAFLVSDTDPFVIEQAVAHQVPQELWITERFGDALIAPLRWDPDGFGALVALGAEDRGGFGDRERRLARGLADITSLALGNARRISELERFEELVKSLDAAFWEAEPSDLTFTYLGGRAGELLGGNVTDWPAARRRWGDHVIEEDRLAAITALRAAAQTGENRSIEYRVPRPGSDTIWIRDSVHIVAGARGTRQLRGLMVDITERKRGEQALRESERQYSDAFRREREASQQLRALDEMKNTFLEAVSHDLRTPLTSILGSALTLEQTGAALPPEDARDLVRRVVTNARKLERLLSDLLDLDRLQRGIVSPQRRPTDLRQLVDGVVAEVENPAGHEIQVEAEQATASVDSAKVERILENLLSNAIRHTPPEARIWVRAVAMDGGIELAVEDDGPGVPEELREAIFQPFRQAPGSSSEHSPGVGIGLSLVRRFAELHGGRAWVEGRPGGGSSFRVFLPGG